MVILTFVNEVVPSEVAFDHINVGVRPYRPRPLQCYNCFGYGHSSKVCMRGKLCDSCSESEHGICQRPPTCINCKESHRPRDKRCKSYKKEEEALLKAQAEHISVGRAKKLLATSKKYSEVILTSATTKLKTNQGVIRHPKVTKQIPSQGSATRNECNSRKEKLPPSEFEISVVSQASTSEAPRVPYLGNSQTSASEVSQAISLPDLESSPVEGLLTDVSHTVVVHQTNENHNMEFRSALQKRPRSPSPSSPPRNVGVPTSNRFGALASEECTSGVKEAPNSKNTSIPNKERESKKSKTPQSTPSLSRGNTVSLKSSKKTSKQSKCP